VFNDGARALDKAAQPILGQTESFGNLPKHAELGIEAGVGRAAAALAR
jgi:hypothetical protein